MPRCKLQRNNVQTFMRNKYKTLLKNIRAYLNNGKACCVLVQKELTSSVSTKIPKTFFFCRNIKTHSKIHMESQWNLTIQSNPEKE